LKPLPHGDLRHTGSKNLKNILKHSKKMPFGGAREFYALNKLKVNKNTPKSTDFKNF